MSPETLKLMRDALDGLATSISKGEVHVEGDPDTHAHELSRAVGSIEMVLTQGFGLRV